MAGMRTTLILSAILVSGLAGGAYVFRAYLLPADSKTPAGEARGKDAASGSRDVSQQERAFVENLTKRRPRPIALDRAEGFVSRDQPVLLPRRESVQPIIPLVQAQHAGADAGATVAMVKEIGADARTREMMEPEEVAPPKHLAAESVLVDQSLPIQRSDDPADVVTVGELLEQYGERVQAEDLYYVHTVRELDDQGIWGIIQDGVVRTFSRGIAMDSDKPAEIIKVDIPTDADELLADASSSFLGKLIYDKAVRTYVYNFARHRMGRNPDVLRPNQEIVIVTFTPEELITIYRHFRKQS